MSSRSNIFFVWSVPRSLSTAFERCFKDRPDFEIIHEPYAECYHYGPTRKSDRYGELEEQSKFTQTEALGRFNVVNTANCLVKDLCFQAEPYVTDEQLAEWRNAVLLRHPYSVAKSLFNLKPDFNEQELGFSELQKVVNRLGYVPPVIEGNYFSQDPEPTLRRFCSAMGTSYMSGYTEWANGAIRDWSAQEYEAHGKWHGNLHASTGIRPSAPVPERSEILGLGLSRDQTRSVDAALEIYSDISAYAL